MEIIVGAAVFLIVILGLYEGMLAVSKIAKISRIKTMALMVANEKLELARHLPYGDLGIEGGWPSGKLQATETIERGGITWQATTTVRQIDDPYDGTVGGSPNDTSPADYKLVEIEIGCGSCGMEPITVSSHLSPLALETANGNGSLFIHVMDASGLPVSEASVIVGNDLYAPPFSISDVTDVNGTLALVDLPPGALSYKIKVTKNGYSQEETYAIGEDDIDSPVNQNATVLAGAVTEISLPIDLLGTVNLQTINQYCQGVGPFSFRLSGTKLVGQDPDVLKYEEDLMTDSGGNLILNNFEWDNYHILPLDTVYDVIGSFPLLSISVNPGTTNDISLVLAPKASQGLLVTAKDGATGLPLDGATVSIVGTSTGQSFEKVTNRGFISETDWSSGGEMINIDTNSPAGEMKLSQVLGSYVSDGYYVSRVLDVGSATTSYHQLSWQPSTQATSTGENSVKFQLASSETAEGPWEFLGPDGTSASYYTSVNADVDESHENKRYLRYKVYLTTADSEVTPLLSDVAITYSSSCLPFGQVFFESLSTETYTVTVTRSGYQEFNGEAVVSGEWQGFEASLNSL